MVFFYILDNKIVRYGTFCKPEFWVYLVDILRILTGRFRKAASLLAHSRHGQKSSDLTQGDRLLK
ncbi:hypothetical protein AMR44_10840 [Shewanella algae]|nr:hypothetical protein AMR44_10840 [Shewanella algae]